jgi:hypothetical protein
MIATLATVIAIALAGAILAGIAILSLYACGAFGRPP